MSHTTCILLLLPVLSSAAACSREEKKQPPPPGKARLGPDARVTARAAPPDAATPKKPDASVDWSNRRPPAPDDPHLGQQGRALLQAVATGRPSLAHGFFFPRQPFTPLKRSRDPDRYWRILLAAYDQDIRRLHRRRRVWSGATFESLVPGTPPVWIAPGRERNRIGYHKTRNARLTFRLGGRQRTLRIHTLISWQGRWYVTHLLPFQRQ